MPSNDLDRLDAAIGCGRFVDGDDTIVIALRSPANRPAVKAIPGAEALRRPRDDVATKVPGDRLLSEDLLAERRAEAARE